MLYPAINISNFKMANGETDDGKLVRHWRKEVLRWHNTQEVVYVYNELLNEDVSIRWWQRLEKENKVPTDLRRRWIIARILDIPILYLGIPTAETLFYSDEIKLPIPTNTPVDIRTYDERLQQLWTSPYGNIDESLMRIYSLQEALIHGSSQQREQIAYLLCQYLVLSGNIQRAEGYLTSAVSYLHKAVNLAREKEYHELYAKALYLRAYCYYELWRVSQDKTKDRQYLLQSIEDSADAANVVNRHQDRFGSALRAASIGDLGIRLAHITQDDKDRSKALNMADKEAAITYSTSFNPDPYFIQIDKSWSSLGKAQTYLALKSPKSAIRMFDGMPEGDPRKMRRFLTRTIAEAEAYTAHGQIDIGVEYAIVALEAAHGLGAKLHLARIACLYNTLRQNAQYRKEPYVARLGGELLKVEHPELFVS